MREEFSQILNSNWYKSIEGEGLEGVWIFGGVIRDNFTGQPIRDVDLFCETTEIAERVMITLRFFEFGMVREGSHVATFSSQQFPWDVQVIGKHPTNARRKRRPMEFSEFANKTIGFRCNRVGHEIGGDAYYAPGAIEDIRSKIATPCTFHNPEMFIYRWMKMSARGFRLIFPEGVDVNDLFIPTAGSPRLNTERIRKLFCDRSAHLQFFTSYYHQSSTTLAFEDLS